MDKHYLTPLFCPESIAVFAGQADAPETLTPQAVALHAALRAQRYTGVLRFLDINTTGTLADLAQARADLAIIQNLAARIGLNWHYRGPHHGVAEVYEEMRQAMACAIGGIGWQRLERESSVTYPCLTEDDPGQPIVFEHAFPTPDGRVQLRPVELVLAAERVDADYPFVLITGRQLEHWHTGSMTRRAQVLDALEPAATASLCGADLLRLGLAAGDRIAVRSRRGQVQLQVRQDDGTPLGAVFIPFAYVEAAANVLTHAALDPVAKIPEFKYCAVHIEAAVSA